MSFHTVNVSLRIQQIEGKRRGIIAAESIPAQTLVEVSPVLLFKPDEYRDHGKYTVLDKYTFTWPTRDGTMALALGIGSLFNHSSQPNVSYSIDKDTLSIRFTAIRAIEEGEELCIFYSRDLWFEAEEPDASRLRSNRKRVKNLSTEMGGLFDPLACIEGEDELDEVVGVDWLPFEELKYLDVQESDISATMEAWVVEIPDPRFTAKLLDYVKSSGLDTPDLAHLKRVRRPRSDSEENVCSRLLLSLTKPILLTPPCDLPEPYLAKVPVCAARTLEDVSTKSKIWPTVYLPTKRDRDLKQWTRREVKWIERGIRKVWEEARQAIANGELPIASFVYFEGSSSKGNLARDTRNSEKHPLRHSIMNLVREVALMTSNSRTLEGGKNGQHYLLTSRTLFTTHEPCIMCSMALLHSRVKDVFYIYSLTQTGGCGGSTCIPGLKGVNHRFGIWKWKDPSSLGVLPHVEDVVDA